MSTFIAKTDYGTNINGYLLDQVVQFDDDKLDTAENIAISEVKGYLGTRYDTAAIFAATGTNRHAKVLDVCIKVTLFELYGLVNPKKTPEHRQASYERAMEWLKGVQEGKIDPPDLPRLTSPDGDYIKYGSNPLRDTRL